ncbi:MAG TPA: DinB family protein [Anaerolineales bacterium]|nr:DinB family protein [Anaerolineales bacterium]
MKELTEYRMNLIERLEDAAHAFREECLAVKDPYAPLDADGWNVHQIAVHTRDVDELVYGLRARRTATEDNPEFPSFDGDAYMGANYNSSESLSELLNGFVENVKVLTELLRALPLQAWSRVSRHPILGSDLTLQTWVEKDLAHIEEHLETVKHQSRK